jgi:hypothetical protein
MTRLKRQRKLQHREYGQVESHKDIQSRLAAADGEPQRSLEVSVTLRHGGLDSSRHVSCMYTYIQVFVPFGRHTRPFPVYINMYCTVYNVHYTIQYTNSGPPHPLLAGMVTTEVIDGDKNQTIPRIIFWCVVTTPTFVPPPPHK